MKKIKKVLDKNSKVDIITIKSDTLSANIVSAEGISTKSVITFAFF